ncbi:MAG: sulfite exporter TauE/SafE family protein [Saprospiraceae bacterium]|nr:sulfite exporter TauE/SafE family protein [Saprospiraceae bacterium]
MPDTASELLQFILVIGFSFGGSFLSFFSGFGLGTILLPIFSLMYAPNLAIASTAIVHLMNNLFKLGLTCKDTDYQMVGIFGVCSILGAFGGAYCLNFLADSTLQISFILPFQKVDLLKLIIGMLIIAFAILEFNKKNNLAFTGFHYKIIGGIVSGFFGGLSGHQGALRSLFLSKSIQQKSVFIATGIMIACMVDLVRIPIYYIHLRNTQLDLKIIVPSVLAAFLGAYYGKKKSENFTNENFKKLVFIFLIVFGGLMILGLV